MKTRKSAAVRKALVVGILLATVAGCTQEGPAERAGKQIDKATASVGQQIEKAGDSIENAGKRDKK